MAKKTRPSRTAPAPKSTSPKENTPITSEAIGEAERAEATDAGVVDSATLAEAEEVVLEDNLPAENEEVQQEFPLVTVFVQDNKVIIHSNLRSKSDIVYLLELGKFEVCKSVQGAPE